MKKFLFFILTIFLLSCNIYVYAFPSYKLPSYTKIENKPVTFIVEIDEESNIYSLKARSLYGIKKENEIFLDSQTEVMSEIKENISPEAEQGFTYTSLFNGFSLEGELNQLEEIKQIPGVKNVYISETIPVPELKISDAEKLTDVYYDFENSGLNGEGQAIAVIDVGCDTGHEFFSSPVKNPKYTKESIYDIIENNPLNADIKSEDCFYKSEKIPFAFNYVTKTSDTYSSTSKHGTHVSGIAVGKNGNFSDGTQFSGIAPEAQLIFLNAGTEKTLSTDTILAALNDAVYLGADIINMSFGISYQDSELADLYKNIVEKAKNKGISIFAAAGNDSRGFSSQTPLTKDIDYSTGGNPANVSDITSVASADNNKSSEISDFKPQISSFSSWGVDSSLELKPEITAPGRNIYSSVPDNKYAYASGTSMSSPHMAGINALIRQFYITNPFSEEFNNLEGNKKVYLLENIAMNTAEILYNEKGVAFSPRNQGAGMVNIKNITESKVTLTGNSGKAKISLGQISDNSFNISFTVTNISKETVTFNDITAELITDGYEEKDGKYYVSDTVPLKYKNINLPEVINLNPGENLTITATVELDEEFIKENSKIFTSGFFIDGFVILRNNEENIKASIPFTGFYGDWNNIPIFDKTAYDEGGSYLIDKENPYSTGTFLSAYDPETKKLYYTGRNMFDNSIVNKKYISYSSKNAFLPVYNFNYFRSVRRHDFYIYDENGIKKFPIYSEDKINKFGNGYFILPKELLKYKKNGVLIPLEEENYTLRIDVSFLGSTTVNDSLTLPLVIDNTSPQIHKITYDKNTGNLSLYASDNHYINGFSINYKTVSGAQKTKNTSITDSDYKNGIAEKTISVPKNLNENDIYINCIDYAFNQTIKPLSLFKDNIGFNINNLTQTDERTSAGIKLRNNTEENIISDIILSFYDEKGTLKSVSIKEDVVINSNEEKDIAYSLFADTTESAKMKIFFFKPNTQIPLSNHKVIDI